MDQHFMQIIQDLTEKVYDLSAIVRQGAHQGQTLDVQAPECDDLHRRTEVPSVEIESFTELLELIPDLEKDFFRFPLAEKAMKDIIYGCPKFTGMNYQPPPLNDAAPTSVKRTDAMLIDIMYKIMDLLGRAPQLVESSMKSLFTGDQLITMISTKKTATRSRTQRKSPFRQRQQPGYGYSAATAPIQQAALAQHQPNTSNNQGGQSQGKRSQNFPQKGKNSGADRERVCDSVQESNPEQESPEKEKFTQVFSEGECRGAADAPTFDDPGGERGHQKGGKSSLVEESYQGGEGESSRVLQQPLHDPKVDRRPPPSIGSPGVQQPYGGVLLQDGDPGIGMQDDQEEGLHGVPGLGRRLHAC
ncbi:hypothetical protein AYI69_g10081, partial [Smittium culicis]